MANMINKNYITSQNSIDIIINTLKIFEFKHIFYSGYADKSLILTLKSHGYSIVVADCYDRTNTSLHFWDDDENLLKNNPMPDWTKDISFQIEGIPQHDILIIDVATDWDFVDNSENIDRIPPTIVFLLNNVDINSFINKCSYEWICKNNIWIGELL